MIPRERTEKESSREPVPKTRMVSAWAQGLTRNIRTAAKNKRSKTERRKIQLPEEWKPSAKNREQKE